MSTAGFPRVGIVKDDDGYWRVTYTARVGHTVNTPRAYLSRADAVRAAGNVAHATGGTVIVNTRDVETCTP